MDSEVAGSWKWAYDLKNIARDKSLTFCRYLGRSNSSTPIAYTFRVIFYIYRYIILNTFRNNIIFVVLTFLG